MEAFSAPNLTGVSVTTAALTKAALAKPEFEKTVKEKIIPKDFTLNGSIKTPQLNEEIISVQQGFVNRNALRKAC